MPSPFTEEQMRLLQDAQRALLSFETAADLDTWMTAVFQAMRPLLRTDLLYYLQPSEVAPPLNRSADTPLDKGGMTAPVVTPGANRDATGVNGRWTSGDGPPSINRRLSSSDLRIWETTLPEGLNVISSGLKTGSRSFKRPTRRSCTGWFERVGRARSMTHRCMIQNNENG
jgi:hypothetical protein